jgi:hypothetical protein
MGGLMNETATNTNHGTREADMTFEEWLKNTAKPSGPYLRELKGGAFQVFTSGLSDRNKWGLHHLEDVVVSSAVSGPSFIVVPRR